MACRGRWRRWTGRWGSSAMALSGELRTEEYQLSEVRLIADATEMLPDFLLLHAGGERRKVWHPIITELAANGFGSVAPDQRGHGDSGGTRADGIAKFGQDVVEILLIAQRPMVVVGASLGGFAAMLASTDVDARRLIAGLVFVDVLPDPQPDRVRAFLATTTPPLDQSPLVDDILGQADALRAACRGIECPVLLVLAGSSAITAEEIERFSASVRHLTIAHIPDASHLIARDCPVELANQLIEFAGNPDIRSRLRSD